MDQSMSDFCVYPHRPNTPGVSAQSIQSRRQFGLTVDEIVGNRVGLMIVAEQKHYNRREILPKDSLLTQKITVTGKLDEAHEDLGQ